MGVGAFGLSICPFNKTIENSGIPSLELLVSKEVNDGLSLEQMIMEVMRVIFKDVDGRAIWRYNGECGDSIKKFSRSNIKLLNR
ncbi:hypothetical protein V6N12_045380 [Hibiscus sabdariffa]|uniref:Uncharacterized protein n=1 Tax=Hibiscus sabdariffa TaxID=183260 RepID=A0ABR2G2K5_9ROSI